jgi:2-oxoglutarate ferredoxin oxidoreductase subunit alpha
MAGWKAMTATSGPGISLYSEQISFAVGSEIPLVIVDVQRLGPSTGSATKGADGDVQFLRWGSSGGLPVVVLSPVDVADCYTLTVEAFNLAERFRCPVFLATNKEIAMTRESVDLAALPLPALVERAPADPARPHLPFAVEPAEQVPRFLPMGGPVPVRQTSSTHGADGFITTDPAVIEAFQRRLWEKIEDQVETFSFFEASGMTAPETVVITYGVTARTAREAVKRLQEDGRRVGLLVLKTLWPVPAALIREQVAACRRVLVAEMNLGQYVHEIRRVLPQVQVDFLGQMNGDLITPGQIREALVE